MFQRCFRGVLEGFRGFQRCFRDVSRDAFEVWIRGVSRAPHLAQSHRNLNASQDQFKFNPSRRGWCFATLYIKYQNECARGLRRQTCNLKVPGSSPGGATRRPRLRETKQPPRRAKQQHTGLQACAAPNRAHGLRSAEKSTLYGVIQFKFKLNQFKFKLILN